MRHRAATMCLAVVLAGPILPQRPSFRTATDAVRVDVLVSDRGRPVSGLTAADFELLDNGVPQTIRLVETGAVPVAVTLVLDTSESVAGERLGCLIDASCRLVGALRAQDRATLIVFADSVRTLVRESSDVMSIRRTLEGLTPGGRTSLNDAAYAGLLLRGTTEGRRLMVLFSDGADTQSWLDRDAVLRVAQAADTVVYGVGLRDRQRSGGDSDLARGALEALPAATGGECFQADASGDLEAVFTRIITEFRQRYWLGYTPADVGKRDQWHTLNVRVKNRRYTIKSRPGYYPRDSSTDDNP